MNTPGDTKKENACMACECPCDMHEEHTHDKKDSDGSVKKCEMCSHEHKVDGTCECGCGS